MNSQGAEGKMNDLRDVEICRLQEECNCLRAEIEQLKASPRHPGEIVKRTNGWHVYYCIGIFRTEEQAQRKLDMLEGK